MAFHLSGGRSCTDRTRAGPSRLLTSRRSVLVRCLYWQCLVQWAIGYRANLVSPSLRALTPGGGVCLASREVVALGVSQLSSAGAGRRAGLSGASSSGPRTVQSSFPCLVRTQSVSTRVAVGVPELGLLVKVNCEFRSRFDRSQVGLGCSIFDSIACGLGGGSSRNLANSQPPNGTCTRPGTSRRTVNFSSMAATPNTADAKCSLTVGGEARDCEQGRRASRSRCVGRWTVTEQEP
jgi:hypothetical protein